MKLSKNSSGNIVLFAVFGNFIIMIAKIFVWLVSSSPSMLAEAIHSAADTINQGLLFIGHKHSQKGPSRAFPLGSGPSRYLWNLISALGVFFIGFGLSLYHGVNALFDPLSSFSSIKLTSIILLISFFVESFVLALAISNVKRNSNESFFKSILLIDNPTTLAVIFEDLIAVLGIFIAFIGIGLSYFLNSPVLDAISSIIIALLMGCMAIILAYLNGRLLIGMATSEAKEEDIRNFIETINTVEKITALKTQILSPGKIILQAEIEFHGGLLLQRKQIEIDAEKIRQGKDPLPILVDTVERTVRTVGNEINQIEKKIREKFPEIVVIDLEVN